MTVPGGAILAFAARAKALSTHSAVAESARSTIERNIAARPQGSSAIANPPQ